MDDPREDPDELISQTLEAFLVQFDPEHEELLDIFFEMLLGDNRGGQPQKDRA